MVSGDIRSLSERDYRDRRLSIVVPCFNEEAVLAETHKRLTSVLLQLGIEYEIVYVDDGSRDNTRAVLREIHIADTHARVLRLSRNFGHQFAITAGIDNCVGDAVILIDADLQDPPEVIPSLIRKWLEGYHVVYAARQQRAGESSFKRWTAALFYRVMNGVSDTPIPLDTGDFRLMDRTVVESVRAMPERDRFLRGMISWIGFRQTAVLYRRDARFAGESKYPLWKMVRFASDGILSFSIAPLRLAIWVGFSASLIALLVMAWAIYSRLFTNHWVTGWTTLMISVLFVGGVQLICLGIIGEYIGRIYGEAKGRPLYIIEERLEAVQYENRAVAPGGSRRG